MTPWHEGYQAYKEGKGIENCPYREYTNDWDQWILGWAACKIGFKIDGEV